MKDKIVNIPNRYSRKKFVDTQQGKLSCEVTPRWISFPNASINHNGINHLHLGIMTTGSDSKDRKLCEIILDRDLLQKNLNNLPCKEYAKN